MSDHVVRRPTVLVAVSSSPSGREALRRAVHEARQRNARLRLIRVWRDIDRLFSMTRTEVSSLGEQECADRAILADATAQVAQLDPAVEVDADFVAGDLYESLLAAAADADVMVVGAGGTAYRSSFIGEWFARHAPCPVIIVDALSAVPARGR